MSKSTIGDEIWLRMTEIERIEVVRSGRATLRQLAQGLLDGSDALRDICRDYLAHTGTELEELPITSSVNPTAIQEHAVPSSDSFGKEISSAKSRAGLPLGFVRHSNRNGRTVLLAENIYRLPDGREFVPARPSGALSNAGHCYALLTLSQYEQSQPGSIYIRLDGRIFDYSNHRLGRGELFDTGFTIADLKRTGHYG
jgi:hypothetical protein